jgi:CSLREA domain-containing protein
MRYHRVFPGLLVGFLLLSCSEPTAPPAAERAAPALARTAAIRVVNSLADPGDGVCTAVQCTLREAIANAATTAITFAPGLVGTITWRGPRRVAGRSRSPIRSTSRVRRRASPCNATRPRPAQRAGLRHGELRAVRQTG